MSFPAYDKGFDELALAARKLAPARGAVAVVVAALVAWNLGLSTAFAWGAALALAEFVNWLTTTPYARGAAIDARRRGAYLAATLAGNFVWLALGVLFWRASASGTAFIALLIWASLLVNAISHAYRSRFAWIVLSTPVMVVMVATPLLVPRFAAPQQAMTVFGVLVCAAYATVSARRNVEAARALAEAQAELARQAEAAEEANRAKSAFLAMMSHELRTPMNGVLGMAHALEATRLTGRQRDYVRTLLRSGEGLMAILNDVLDLAKIEAGRLDILREPFDLELKLAKVATLWETAAEEKGLRLICEIDPVAPRWVEGDPARLRQILMNLVSNAIKFTQTGEVRVSIVPGATPGLVAFVVADTGSGMDEATQARLFQGFVQGDSSIARRFGGTGLGLAISRQLARLMGGDIAVESRLGEGSRFTLTLPLPACAPPAEAPPRAEAALLDRSVRVLVVDDNAANREVARALLEALGVEVETAPGGREGLAALSRAPFDLVFMDIHMPGMSGDQALAAIRASGSPFAAVPVVALTADAMAGERERLLALGFDGYLSKPISPQELLRVLAG
ncbi:MAG: ATP-binding protein [Phenylobacterium sp.]|uniref:ATP-binding protein n=1 Tax=Phenylobacterium sp. TaxID=1871053 RepID=UPI003919133C